MLLHQDSTGGAVYLQRGGDLITAIDGQPVTKMDDLLIYLEEQASPGDKVTLGILRGSDELTLSVLCHAPQPGRPPRLRPAWLGRVARVTLRVSSSLPRRIPRVTCWPGVPCSSR